MRNFLYKLIKLINTKLISMSSLFSLLQVFTVGYIGVQQTILALWSTLVKVHTLFTIIKLNYIGYFVTLPLFSSALNEGVSSASLFFSVDGLLTSTPLLATFSSCTVFPSAMSGEVPKVGISICFCSVRWFLLSFQWTINTFFSQDEIEYFLDISFLYNFSFGDFIQCS